MLVKGAVYLSGGLIDIPLNQGAGVNTLTGEGVPVLSLAVRTGCLKCTEALVEGGAALGAQAKG